MTFRQKILHFYLKHVNFSVSEEIDVTGSELKDTLKRLGISQSKFAKEIDVREETVSRWVKGKIPVPQVVSKYVGLKMRVLDLQIA